MFYFLIFITHSHCISAGTSAVTISQVMPGGSGGNGCTNGSRERALARWERRAGREGERRAEAGLELVTRSLYSGCSVDFRCIVHNFIAFPLF